MKSSRHYKLNQKQLHILKLLFKFRFLTVPLLAQYKNLNKDSVTKSLRILLDQGYVGRHYQSSYKLLGKAARYYLAPKALKLLRDNYNFDTSVLHAMYKNKSVTEAFVDQCLNICRAYLSLNRDYPDGFHIYTRTELTHLDSIPDPAPHLLLSRKDPRSGLPSAYFLEMTDTIPVFIIKKRLQAYLEHLESGDWEDGGYPTVLVVCENPSLEAKVLKLAENLLDGGEELQIRTTTTNALFAENLITEIWSQPEKTNLISL